MNQQIQEREDYVQTVLFHQGTREGIYSNVGSPSEKNNTFIPVSFYFSSCSPIFLIFLWNKSAESCLLYFILTVAGALRGNAGVDRSRGFPDAPWQRGAARRSRRRPPLPFV